VSECLSGDVLELVLLIFASLFVSSEQQEFQATKETEKETEKQK
jgi:hypothetical protein